ncbi:turripeptide Ici9.1-like [Crassostrea virginica]|uniref:Turripeptide Ici9.1-like n=1 Tax=Crassostrea virginica TaxID=6565 RepID=A0A8B8F0S8_CRAVI|nr:turripeptide Ici9.1-like [Crassostrea virginica]
MKYIVCLVVLIAVANAAPVNTHCSLICPFIYLPICGSNGRTYDNECEMNVENCLNKTHTLRVSQGPCPGSTTDASAQQLG